MGKSGDILVAWPEDYVLSGGELEELTTTLAPQAEIISQTPTGPDIAPAVDAYEVAIANTMQFLSRPLSHASLRTVVQSCLERTAPTEGYTVRRPSCLSIALANLVERGDVDESITEARLSLPASQNV